MQPRGAGREWPPPRASLPLVGPLSAALGRLSSRSRAGVGSRGGRGQPRVKPRFGLKAGAAQCTEAARVSRCLRRASLMSAKVTRVTG